MWFGFQKTEQPAKCAGMMIHSGGKFLLLHRSDRDEWEQPGGHLNPGENTLDAAKRETREEIGDVPGASKPVHVKRTVGNGVDFSTYLTNTPKQFTPKLSDEHTAFAWHSPDDLPAKTHPKVAETIRELGAKMQKGDFTLAPGDAGYLEPEEGPTVKRINHQGTCESVHPGMSHDAWLKSIVKDEVSDMIGRNPSGVADNQPPNQPW